MGARFAEIYSRARGSDARGGPLPLRALGRRRGHRRPAEGAAIALPAPLHPHAAGPAPRGARLLATAPWRTASSPIEAPISESELNRVHNLLADVIEGRSLGEVRDLFARRLAEDRVAVDALRRRAFELGSLRHARRRSQPRSARHRGPGAPHRPARVHRRRPAQEGRPRPRRARGAGGPARPHPRRGLGDGLTSAARPAISAAAS